MGSGMSKNEAKHETKLMESVIALAEELHFGRAARRLRISQPMLTKNIQDVEALIGGPLFLRDRKHVVLSDAGRAYVQQARLSLLYGERAVQSARAVMQGMRFRHLQRPQGRSHRESRRQFPDIRPACSAV